MVLSVWSKIFVLAFVVSRESRRRGRVEGNTVLLPCSSSSPIYVTARHNNDKQQRNQLQDRSTSRLTDNILPYLPGIVQQN